jgi:Domain of unknown function (DUF4111)
MSSERASRSASADAGLGGELVEYLQRLRARLEAQLGDRLLAAWVIGSGALGDFDRLRSDIDVQAATSARLSRRELAQLAASLSHDVLPCPARGLEFVLYAHDDLSDPDGPAFQLNLNTGRAMTQHEGFEPRSEPRFWFTLDVAIARERARRLTGERPADVLPQLPRRLVGRALTDALDWYQGHDPAQAVLAACRAWAWAADGAWLSKGDAARWATARLVEPGAVTRALQHRADRISRGPTPSEAATFVAFVQRALAGAERSKSAAPSYRFTPLVARW